MKLIINYDFFEEVLNARESLGPLKIVRNQKRTWAKFHLPIFTAIDLISWSVPETIVILGMQFCTITYLELIAQKLAKTDIYGARAVDNLKELAWALNDLTVKNGLNLKTDYDLLLQSELYKKEYKIEVNENKIPYIAESKYIMIPTKGFNGTVDTSILQQHVVGSKEYVLSLGSPKKEFKRSFVESY